MNQTNSPRNLKEATHSGFEKSKSNRPSQEFLMKRSNFCYYLVYNCLDFMIVCGEADLLEKIS